MPADISTTAVNDFFSFEDFFSFTEHPMKIRKIRIIWVNSLNNLFSIVVNSNVCNIS